MSGNKTNQTLSAKQQRAIKALLTEPTTRAAAEAAKVSEATIWRWLADPDFDQAYRAAREQLYEATLASLQEASTLAVETLRQVMDDPKAPAPARVSAARCVLEMSIRARETLDVEERLRELETYFDTLSSRAVKISGMKIPV